MTGSSRCTPYFSQLFRAIASTWRISPSFVSRPHRVAGNRNNATPSTKNLANVFLAAEQGIQIGQRGGNRLVDINRHARGKKRQAHLDMPLGIVTRPIARHPPGRSWPRSRRRHGRPEPRRRHAPKAADPESRHEYSSAFERIAPGKCLAGEILRNRGKRAGLHYRRIVSVADGRPSKDDHSLTPGP